MPQRSPRNRKVAPRLVRLEDRTQPSASAVIAFGADPGGLPYVRLYNPATDSQVRAFLAYDQSFTGGVRVAEADVNGDGIPDIITAPGPGGGPHIKVFDGRTGALISQFFAYAPSFSGGVSVAVGDVTGDGKPDIITGAGPSGGPHVKVFDLQGNVEQQFYAYDPSFTGGVNVAVGDTTTPGQGNIITGAGAGGGPHVKVFDSTGAIVASFFAYGASFHGGVNVAAADLTGNGVANIITGAGAGGGPHVKVFDGTGGLQTQFFAFGASYTGGVRVAADDVNGDSKLDLVVAAGLNGNARWRAFDSTSLNLLADSTAFAFPFAGGVTVAGCTPEAIAVANEDAVVAWNGIMLSAIHTSTTPPPQAARIMAMVQTAVYDAVNAVVPLHAFYHAAPTLNPTADMTAAASQAAHDTLVALFPSLATTFDADLATWLAKVPAGQALTDGVALGQQAAAAILALRANDGSNAVVPYTPGSNPGQYQLTPPNFSPPLDPQWPYVTPFAMTSDTQFRPPGPPALTSQQYADDFNQVKSLGGTNSTTRTADQTLLAHFWADVPGHSATPPGHWNEIATVVSLQRGLSLAENARLFAQLGIALADAGIVAWDAKYAFDFWRPITAIQNAGSDGNPLTDPDPTWTPLWTTPAFSEYTSGHSTFSGAAQKVLDATFGANTAFTVGSDDMPGYTRSFTSFQQAADEAGFSRIVGGIHFMSANRDGLASGRALGQYVVNSELQ
jgi:hypothetical protein